MEEKELGEEVLIWGIDFRMDRSRRIIHYQSMLAMRKRKRGKRMLREKIDAWGVVEGQLLLVKDFVMVVKKNFWKKYQSIDSFDHSLHS